MTTLPTPAPAAKAAVLFDSARHGITTRSFAMGLSSAGLPASEITDSYWYGRSVDRHRAAGRAASFATRDARCPAGATSLEEKAWDLGYAAGRRAIDQAYESGRCASLADASPTPPTYYGEDPEGLAKKGAWLDGFGDAEAITARNWDAVYEAHKEACAIETYLRTYESIPSDDALVMV